MKYIVSITVIIFFFTFCRKPYTDISLDNTNSALVVEGIISNDPPPYKIRLSYSVPFNSTFDKNYITKAKITIIDDNGKIENVVENPKTTGTYQTSANGLQGEIGRSYKLKITINNRFYESSWEKITAAPVIDSIYPAYGQKEYLVYNEKNSSYLKYLASGMNLYISINPVKNDDYYYKIKSTAIQESECFYYPQRKIDNFMLDYENPYTVYTWNSYVQTNLLTNVKSNIKPIANYLFGFALEYQQETLSITRLPFGNAIRTQYDPKMDVIFNRDTLYNFPSPIDSPHFSNRKNDGMIFIGEVFSVSKKIFNIFNEENSQINPQNTIYDPLPTQLSTNIECLSNATEKPFGYFAAMCIARKYRYLYWHPGLIVTEINKEVTNFPIEQYNGSHQLYKPNFWIPY